MTACNYVVLFNFLYHRNQFFFNSHSDDRNQFIFNPFPKIMFCLIHEKARSIINENMLFTSNLFSYLKETLKFYPTFHSHVTAKKKQKNFMFRANTCYTIGRPGLVYFYPVFMFSGAHALLITSAAQPISYDLSFLNMFHFALNS